MNILVVATALDTPKRQGELLAAAVGACGDGGGRITVLNTGTQATQSAGAAEAFELQTPLVDQASSDALLDVIAQASARFKPTVLLLTGDDAGHEAGARLTVRLGAACISGCSGFERSPKGELHYLRSVFGGRALETLASMAPLTIVCIKPKAFAPSATNASTCPVQAVDIKPASDVTAITRLEVVTMQQSSSVALEEASIIVSGGRGVNGVNGFAQLNELAHVLGGALGASRAAVDMGWISAVHQVGQTGKTVAPGVYLAVGISGAMQHLAGISAAQRVVAVNTDDQAPIFGVADVGVVADAHALITALLGEIKAK